MKKKAKTYHDDDDEKFPCAVENTYYNSIKKKDPPKLSRRILAQSVDRDYFQELVEGVGLETNTGCSEMVLRIGSKELTRERVNHVLREAGEALVGLND